LKRRIATLVWGLSRTTFEIPPIKLSFSGTLNEGGDKAQGTWRQAGLEFPLTLEKHAVAYENRKVWE